MEKLRIVFMGTPEFAVGILDAILKNKFEVVGVITAADKPAGRGQKIKYSAVKEYALTHALKILQPTNLKDEAFLDELKSLNANCQVVVAFRMLPEVVWKMPKFGTFNLHASLLPNYRGAAPINWAIINGEEKTGVTTFFIDDKIDTGAMILSAETPIHPKENAGELHDRLMKLGCKTVVDTLIIIEKEDVQTTLQKETSRIKDAPKLNKDNCKIDWSKPTSEIFNQIRGLSPYPTAWTTIQDNNQEWIVKLFEAELIKENHSKKPGSIQTTKKELFIYGIAGTLKITQLQFPGKKKMTAAEILNGMQFSESAKVV
jgi:methionyl-tRNA formyltransferase